MTTPPPGPGYGSQPEPYGQQPQGQPYGQPQGQQPYPPTPQYGQPPYGAAGPPPYGAPEANPYAIPHAAPDGSAKTLGIVSIVVGLIAIPLGCCCWPVGALAALVALICGGMGLSKANALQGDGNERTLAIIGIVLGVVAFGVTIIGLRAGIANVATNSY